MASKALSFDVGDYVVYPKHGVGRVIELQSTDIAVSYTHLDVYKRQDQDPQPGANAVHAGAYPHRWPAHPTGSCRDPPRQCLEFRAARSGTGDPDRGVARAPRPSFRGAGLLYRPFAIVRNCERLAATRGILTRTSRAHSRAELEPDRLRRKRLALPPMA